MVKYSQIHHQATRSRLEKRYEHEIIALKNLGFRHLAYCLEDHGPYSVITQLLVIPLALLKGEILIFKRPFKLASANVLLSTQSPSAIALCMGMGIKFYSGFSDGTLIITSNFTSSAVPRPGSKITRLRPQPTLKDTWAFHKKEVLNRLHEVTSLAEDMKFEHYVEMSAIEEDVTQYTTS
jgi:hypothetical protein